MKKLIIFTILITLSGTLCAQTARNDLGQADNAVKTLATELGRKLAEEKVQTIVLGQFVYMGGATRFNAYLGNQLSGELTGMRGRSFTLVSGGAAEWVISGEIVRVADLIRVYTRLIRRSDNAVVSQIHIDLEMNQSVASMLFSGDSDGGMVMYDDREPDSWDNPVTYDADAGVAPVGRTIHGSDEDWFLILPDHASELVMETTGNMDTYMELYDADTRLELASDDDGAGEGNNAGIRYIVQAGKRYIIKVRGYSSDTTGEYGFVAHTENLGETVPYEVLADINAARFVMRTLDGSSDLFLLTPGADGMMVMETTGNIDVFMEFYDAGTYELLATDDDSGHDNNARIAHEVQAGTAYIAKVRGYSSDTRGQYGFKSYLANY